jgi:conjugative transposon TraK protein
MFKSAKNIDTAFKQLRIFSIVVIACCFSLSALVSLKSYQLARSAQSRIYVIAGGKAFEAWASDRKENLAVEARDHVKTFHQYFFSLDPDEKVIESNITKALYLADGSARKVYESLKENNYYSGIISGNISQEIRVDSVKVNTVSSPLYFKCWLEQKIIRPSSITTRSLITEGYLREVARSDNNPHGFLIEKWNTLENRDIKTEKR